MSTPYLIRSTVSFCAGFLWIYSHVNCVEAAEQPADAPQSTSRAAASRIQKPIPRDELEALNQKLREAMALYYDRSYRLALPIFKEIALRLDTIDVLYWTGRSAFRTGESDLAIENFKKILERDPSLLPVRLELAAVYIQTGDIEGAKNELRTVLDQNPPENVRQSADDLLSRIERSDKQWFSSLRTSVGTEYDSNINIALNNNSGTLVLDDGSTLTTAERLRGWLVKTNLNGDLLYDFGERDGFVWRNQVYFLHNEYVDSPRDDFNYTVIDVRSGIEYYAEKLRLRMPVAFLEQRFSNAELSRSFYTAPSLEYSLTENLDFQLGYRFDYEEFVADGTDDQDNYTNRGIFGPRYRFETGNATHVVSLLATVGSRNAEAVRFSFDDWSIGPSYFVRFDTGTELYVEGRFLDRDYQAPALLFNSLGDRQDDRYTASVVLSQSFLEHFFVSATFTYIRNDSNVPIFDYKKTLAGLNFGVNYNF
jgi:FimV-like protein